MADGRHFENRQIAISLQPFDQFWWNLADHSNIVSVYSSGPTRTHAHVMAYLSTLLFHINTGSNFVAIAHRLTYRYSCNTSGHRTCYAISDVRTSIFNLFNSRTRLL